MILNISAKIPKRIEKVSLENEKQWMVMSNLVFAQILVGFRYGRDDLDVLGLNFRRDLLDVSDLSLELFPLKVFSETDSSLSSARPLPAPVVNLPPS